MFRTDTGNFNRFLTSLGLLLLAGSLVVPYFYFRSTEVLEIPARDLNRMTETGKEALTARQDTVASLELWITGAAVIIGLVGVVLVVLGGLRLRSAQASDMRRPRFECAARGLTSKRKSSLPMSRL